ncbi:protein IQ-DOMAIN 31 isoform X2 [Elaeis guineensis]|uniref:Protein IQ-DOMAIN 31 isoform X2 n=1 Tax=Elaeis guineensis var. tenera TaxID=51953 RepID=A0A6J0PAP8_ELAGV|nr:protein IQ-DOMAIN 31 isoform X2 [Elaeis guineensis]
MGKSPGKWIKTLLFGKKSARSHATKGRDASKCETDKGYIEGKAPPALAANSPDEEKQESAGYEASNDPEKFREEQAAIKAQAAFRGYLARRAFHALKGIIRLQALIRGHLVRRQAVATLRALHGIVKLQAVVRGRRVRCSSVGFKIHTKLAQGNTTDAKLLDSWKEKLLTNAFFCKLLSSSHIAKPLRIQYDQGDPNSIFSWLERWTSTHFWKLLERPKKATDSKSRTRRCSYAMETESGRSKRSVRRNSAMNVDPAQTNVTSEAEKTKCNLRKVSGSPADSVQEHPQTEIEKVKRNLRKVSNSMTEASDHLEVETEKPIGNARKVSSSPSDAPDQGPENCAEKIKKGVIPTPETKPGVETVSKSAVMEGPADALPDDSSATESHQLQSIDNEEKALGVNGELISMAEQPFLESQKTKKRRSSFSARSEYAENGLQNTPVLPSYMATTQSSKAKFRGQISPRFGTDSVDKNDITRRHSLPSSTNGKLSSPRTQRLFPANGKGGNRSFFSSSDGHERAIRVEWRR